MRPLPQDVARCNGQTDSADKLQPVCVKCLRRTAPPGERQPYLNGRLMASWFCLDVIDGVTKT